MMLPASGYSKTLMHSAINPMTGFQEFFDEDWLNERAKKLGWSADSGQKRGEYFADQGLADVWKQVKFNESGGAIGQNTGVNYSLDDAPGCAGQGNIASYQTIGANKPGMTGPNDNTVNHYAIGDNTNTIGYGSIQIGGADGVSAVNISPPIDPTTGAMPTAAQPWNNSVNAFIQNGVLSTRGGSDFTGGLEGGVLDFQPVGSGNQSTGSGGQAVDIQALIDSITGALGQNNQQSQPVIPTETGTQTFDMQSFFQQFMQMQMLMQMLGMNGGTLPMALAGMLGNQGGGVRYVPSGAGGTSGGGTLGGTGYGGYGSRIDPFTGAIIANPAQDQWRYGRRLEALA